MAAPHPLSPDLAATQADPADAALGAEKAALRTHARAIRARLSPALGEAAARHILTHLPLSPGQRIAGTWPMEGEMDLRPLWATLHAQGQHILLPETPPRGRPLIFRTWTPGSTMRRERFGTLCPTGDAAVPDMIIVPFLAFDAAGHRLGYGGGYYDRTLAALPGVPAIGAGYAALQVAHVPAGPHDRPLDAVFTEEGVAQGQQFFFEKKNQKTFDL